MPAKSLQPERIWRARFRSRQPVHLPVARDERNYFAAAIQITLSACGIRPARQRQQSGQGRSFLSCKELAPSLWCARRAWARHSAVIHPNQPLLRPEIAARMLRGIHKASSTWLGKAVMAAVMGVILRSVSRSGASGTYSAALDATRWPRSAAPKLSIEQFRQFYNDRLQQLGRQVGPTDYAR